MTTRTEFRRMLFGPYGVRMLITRLHRHLNHRQRKRLEARIIAGEKVRRMKTRRPIPTVRVIPEECWSNQKRRLSGRVPEMSYGNWLTRLLAYIW